MNQPHNRKAYIIGGGIGGLASAVYLIRDGRLPGECVHIFEEADTYGGALDAGGSIETGYIMRGGRMFDEHYVCTYDLLSEIPSYDDPAISARDDIFSFSKETSWYSRTRLIDKEGAVVAVSSMGFDTRDRLTLVRLLLRSEQSLGAKHIVDVFDPHFFTTNFWFMWCSMFAFQPWHSAVEMRRYLLRFIHLFPSIATMTSIYHTRYSQYHSIVLPIQEWLRKRGVRFESGTRVLDMEFQPAMDRHEVRSLKCRQKENESEIAVGESDLVIFTNGSMTSASTVGSMKAPAVLNRGDPGGAWTLWKNLAAKRNGFGHPDTFIGEIEKSKWLSFTATTTLPLFRTLFLEMTNNELGREGLITFKDSNWLLTIKLHYNPVYPTQPDEAMVWWGYGLNPDREGNFIKKQMADCTGEELLYEAFSHLRFGEHIGLLMQNSRALPCMMPYITSQFMPRVKGDRPEVVPKGSVNLAFVSQYCEIPVDTVFTVEYSVRAAKMAVNSLLGLGAKIPPVYQGHRNPWVLLRAARESMR